MSQPKANTLAILEPHFINNETLDIPTFQLLKQDGTLYKGASLPDISKETALRIYDNMVYIRVLDERLISAQRQGRISFYMTCIGMI